MKKISLIFIFVLLPLAFSHAIPRRMLYEFTTATNCTHCACMDSVVKKVILVNYPQTVVLAYHTDMVVPPPSPYTNFDGRQIVDTLCGWEVDWRAITLLIQLFTVMPTTEMHRWKYQLLQKATMLLRGLSL
ncbi:MAG: hypothetical protein NTV87_06490 [Ignavibacteriae bacterium]|nr:hypothetical protein [Ignavibacteriota bacterium]